MLEPSEVLNTEPGSMMFMSPAVETNVECGCFDGCVRMCAGEPCVKVQLENGGGDSAYVGLTPNFPAKVRRSQDRRMGGVQRPYTVKNYN